MRDNLADGNKFIILFIKFKEFALVTFYPFISNSLRYGYHKNINIDSYQTDKVNKSFKYLLHLLIAINTTSNQ